MEWSCVPPLNISSEYSQLSRIYVYISIWSILMHFNCLFWLQLTSRMRLESDIVLLVEHFDKRTRHEALHQSLFAVHVILVDG